MYISNRDLARLTGRGPKIVAKQVAYRRQGNGRYTGLIRTTYDDGSYGDFEFIVNAGSLTEVRAACETCGVSA